jgi:putative membrane protein
MIEFPPNVEWSLSHMTEILVRYAHFIAILILAGMLISEHLLLKAEMTAAEIRRIALVDMVYGISAGVVLAAGLALWLGGIGKPTAFYSANPVFHAKLGLFVLIALISFYPTAFFLKQRARATAAVAVPRSIVMVVRLELLFLLVLPLLATLMARGYGLHG